MKLVVLDYNPKCKTNIHESILIKINYWSWVLWCTPIIPTTQASLSN